MSASDANRDGQVTRAGMEDFASNGPERQVGMVAYFDQYDADADGVWWRAQRSKTTWQNASTVK